MRALAHRREPADDAGFSLVEVVVALSLVAMVAAASLAFFVSGTRSVTHQQREQSAIALANDQMEAAYSLVASSSGSSVTGLAAGRTQADVVDAWNTATALGAADLADTYPAWDVSTSPAPATGSGDDAVKQVVTQTLSRQTYTVTTLIGYCFRTSTPTTVDANCTRTGGADMSGGAAPAAGYARIVRAIVLVTWPDETHSCTGGTCLFQISGLIDPNADLKWNNTTRLAAVDDAVNVQATDTMTIDVMANDVLMSISSNPVSIVSQPVLVGTSTAAGTASLVTVAGTPTGDILYAPSADAHGEVTFVYRLTVGARTSQATVHAYVKPSAGTLTAQTTAGGSAVTMPVTTSWGTTPTSVAIDAASGPAKGTATVSGTSLVYNPTNAVAGQTYSFQYTYTDSTGTVSTPGTARVTISSYPTPTASPVSLAVNANDAATAVPISLPAGYSIQLRSLPTVGTASLGGTAVTAANTTGAANAGLTFAPDLAHNGTQVMGYSIVTPDGTASAPSTVTVTVKPVALTLTDPNLSRNTGRTYTVAAGYTEASVSLTSAGTCGTNPVTNSIQSAGTLTYKPNRSGTCTFTYTLTPSNTSISPVTGTLKVTTP